MINIPVKKKKKVAVKKPKVMHSHIADRVLNKNKNFVGMFNGDTGSAKSYACLKLSSDLSEKFGTSFSIKDNVAFNFDDLLTKLELPHNEKPGTCFIMEEVGAFGSGAAAREWQSKGNKFFFSFLQTSRHRRQVLFLNCPSFSYLEKGCRELVNAQFEAKGVNFQNKRSYFKPFIIQVNRRNGKLYFKYLRYKFQGIKHVFSEMAFKLPDEQLLKEYEIEKRKFTDALNKAMKTEEEEKVDKRVKLDVEKFKELLKKDITQGEMAKILGVARQTVVANISKYRDDI